MNNVKIRNHHAKLILGVKVQIKFNKLNNWFWALHRWDIFSVWLLIKCSSRALGSTAVSIACLDGEIVSPVEGNLLEACNHFEADKEEEKTYVFQSQNKTSWLSG